MKNFYKLVEKAFPYLEKLVNHFDVRQLWTRDGKFFPPYFIMLFFIGIDAAFLIQRLLGINNISDTLMGILTGVVGGWVSVFWLIDNRGNQSIEK